LVCADVGWRVKQVRLSWGGEREGYAGWCREQEDGKGVETQGKEAIGCTQ